MVDQAAGLGGKEERFLAFHGIGALISHVEGMAGMIASSFLGGGVKIHILEQTHVAHQFFATGEENLFESL